jgi:hypothetical protein
MNKRCFTVGSDSETAAALSCVVRSSLCALASTARVWFLFRCQNSFHLSANAFHARAHFLTQSFCAYLIISGDGPGDSFLAQLEQLFSLRPGAFQTSPHDGVRLLPLLFAEIQLAYEVTDSSPVSHSFMSSSAHAACSQSLRPALGLNAGSGGLCLLRDGNCA